MKIGIDYDSEEAYEDSKPLLHAMFCSYMRRRSASGRGYHVLLDVPDLPPEVALVLRAILGDDEMRILWDRKRLEHGGRIDRLFYFKDGQRPSEWQTIYT